MQRKPALSSPPTTHRPPDRKTAPSRLRRSARRRRRDAVNHLLRGICYGLGTGAAGLAFWWLEQHL